MKQIIKFSGKFAFLSNFAYSPIVLEDGKIWLTVEHLYQASKTFSKLQREEVRFQLTPGRAKRLGQRVDLRPDWEKVKEAEMLKCIRLKFEHNPALCRELIKTGDTELIKGNHRHDNTWGNCRCSKCKNVPGQNLLGKILMRVREEVK